MKEMLTMTSSYLKTQLPRCHSVNFRASETIHYKPTKYRSGDLRTNFLSKMVVKRRAFDSTFNGRGQGRRKRTILADKSHPLTV